MWCFSPASCQQGIVRWSDRWAGGGFVIRLGYLYAFLPAYSLVWRARERKRKGRGGKQQSEVAVCVQQQFALPHHEQKRSSKKQKKPLFILSSLVRCCFFTPMRGLACCRCNTCRLQVCFCCFQSTGSLVGCSSMVGHVSDHSLSGNSHTCTFSSSEVSPPRFFLSRKLS